MDGFLLEIITPEKQFFKGEAEQIICETESGKLGILKGHQTMVSALEIGEIQIKTNGEWKSAFISEGFMEVRRDEVVIFSQCCQWPDEIDGARAEESRIRALDRKDAETVPIIAMTANLFIRDIEKCFSVGMNGYVPKPINEKQLVKIIAEKCAERKQNEA